MVEHNQPEGALRRWFLLGMSTALVALLALQALVIVVLPALR